MIGWNAWPEHATLAKFALWLSYGCHGDGDGIGDVEGAWDGIGDVEGVLRTHVMYINMKKHVPSMIT